MATARSSRAPAAPAAPAALERSRRQRSRHREAVVAPRIVAANPDAAQSAAAIRQLLSVVAIALSSASMFTLELLSGQRVLPIFGGSPGVWATALCFFTIVLMGGYAYAHVLVTRVGRRKAGVIHVCLAIAALIAAILDPGSIASLRIDGLAETVNVLFVLVIIAGLPAFLFSTTTPLLSAWYSRDGSDPWWLYAASNAASLIGVLAYPFIIQPVLPLSVQRVGLVGAVGLFALLLVTIVLRDRSMPDASAGASADADADDDERAAGVDARISAAPDRWRQARWLATAFVPAGLLAATTNYITTDLISAPLLWIGPLAIYLASFTIAFSDVGRRRILPVAERLVPAAATLLWIPWLLPYSWPVSAVLLLELCSFAVLAIAIHGRLATDRPSRRHLTRFYLVLSLGGVLATAFVALLAPLVFTGIDEYPILIVAAIAVMVILPGPDLGPHRTGIRALALGTVIRVAPYAAAAALFLILSSRERTAIVSLSSLLIVGGVLIALVRPYKLLAPISAILIVVLAVAVMPHALVERRTFFGVTTVQTAANGLAHAEYSGTTLHGIEYLDSRSEQPTSYYIPSGPFGDVFKDLRGRTAGANIGVVGLGTGTIASFAQKGDSLTFYEIDPAVIDIAQDPAYFTYLSGAAVKPKIVPGDGRLSLESVPPDTFDLLVLDAFTSDAPPAHLLTQEAMQTYERAMRPGGIIVYNVSNRYYDLGGAIMSTANSIGLAARQLEYIPGQANIDQYSAAGSTLVVVGSTDDMLRFQNMGWGGGAPGPVLTDDFFDLLRMLEPGSI